MDGDRISNDLVFKGEPVVRTDRPGRGAAHKARSLILISLMIICLLLTWYFHGVMGSASVFTHFYYIPIVLSAFWWKRKALVVPILLGLGLIVSRFCCLIEGRTTYDDYLRSIMFLVVGVVVAFLSERIQKAEEQVVQSEARYRSMFEHMSDGVAVFEPVENGRDFSCVDLNKGAEKIKGCGREQLLGKGLGEMPSDLKDSGFVDILRRVASTGKPEAWTAGSHRETGTGVWRDMSAYKLPSGEIVVICSDKTEQRRAQQRAVQLASIVESSDAAILSISLDGEILTWNSGASRVYGWESDEILGDCILTLVPPDHWETVLKGIDDVKSSEKRDHVETVHVTKAGRHIDVSLIMSPLRDLEGKVVGVSFIARNIMKRKEAERALQRAYEQLERKVEERTTELAAANEDLRREIAERQRVEKELEESSEKIKLFAYLICHDLKSPAVGIYGLSRLLRNQYGDSLDEKGKEYCEQILNASRQVGCLVEKINVYISTKESSLNLERVEVKEIFETIRDEFSPRIQGSQVVLIDQDTVAEVWADRLYLLRVFRNLVDNALKYGGDQLSEIRLGYEETADLHVFSVHDNGVGVRSEDSQRIFGMFQRDTTSRGIEGSGLGLAIVKEAAERHHGRVWIESEPGRGTSFFVSISKTLC